MTTPTDAARVRSQVDHPIIDADGHFVELGPLLNDEVLAYIDEMGGRELRDVYAKRSGVTDTSTVLADHAAAAASAGDTNGADIAGPRPAAPAIAPVVFRKLRRVTCL